MKKGTIRRIEKTVDVLTQLGVAAIIGGTADAFVDGTRKVVDVYGIIIGAVTIGAAIWLTGKVNGDTL